MLHARSLRTYGILLPLLFIATAPLTAQTFIGLRIGSVFVTLTPTWIYNGFTETDDGTPVQGSDVSPIRFSAGAGFELEITERHSLQPEAWLYLQEYIALDNYDKTVPTQIETGQTVGDIANTIGLALAVPWVYTRSFPNLTDWEFSGHAGLALIFRIPIAGIDGSDAGPVGAYWIAGRFIYPYLGVGADYRFSDRMSLGAGLSWYVPLYNVWDDDEDTPFLDETMLRYGLRVRFLFGTDSR